MEIFELIEVWPFKIVEVKNGKLRVGEGVEDAFVVGARELLVVGDRAELAFRIEDAHEGTGRADFLALPDVVEGGLRDGFERVVPGIGILLLELVEVLDLLILNFF